MSEPTGAVHKAIYGALNAALSVAVYDGASVPPDADLEAGYVTIDTLQAAEDDRYASKADTTTVYLTVWRSGGGKSRLYALLQAVTAALDRRRNLPMDTGRIVIAFVAGRTVERDPADANVVKAPLRVRCHVEH